MNKNINRITYNILTSYVAQINQNRTFKNGRKMIVNHADQRVGRYNIRMTGGDLQTGESDVFYGSAKECYAYLKAIVELPNLLNKG